MVWVVDQIVCNWGGRRKCGGLLSEAVQVVVGMKDILINFKRTSRDNQMNVLPNSKTCSDFAVTSAPPMAAPPASPMPQSTVHIITSHREWHGKENDVGMQCTKRTPTLQVNMSKSRALL